MGINARLSYFAGLRRRLQSSAKWPRAKLRDRWFLASRQAPADMMQDGDDFPLVSDSDAVYVEIDRDEDYIAWAFAPIDDMPSPEAMMALVKQSGEHDAQDGRALRPWSVEARSRLTSARHSAPSTSGSKRHRSRSCLNLARELGTAVKEIIKPACKRQRTRSPAHSLAVFVSSTDGRDDLASSFAASYSDDAYPLVDEMLSWLHVNGGYELPADAVNWAAVSGLVSDAPASVSPSSPASISSGRARRVSFAPGFVTGVKEIPSHCSLTKEEKVLLYRDPRTLHEEAETSKLERKFDRSYRCIENTCEENMFFRTHLGELVHPAHFGSYCCNVLLRLPRDTPVVGYSRKEYLELLMEYLAFYEAALRDGRFVLQLQ
jgi:hypothetical protein